MKHTDEQKIAVNVLIEMAMKTDTEDNGTLSAIGMVINKLGSQAIDLVREKINKLREEGEDSQDSIEMDNLILVFSYFDEDLWDQP